MKKINKNKLKINLIVNKITSDRAGVVLFFLSFLLILFLFSTINFVRAEDEDDIMEKKEEYEDELKDLEKDAEKVETEIQQVNNQIYQTQTVIQKTAQVVEELEGEIETKEEMIEKKEKNIVFKKKILEEYVRLYRRNILELGLVTFSLNRDLGQYLRDTEKFEDFQSRIKDALDVIKEEKLAIENEKNEIEEKKEEKDEALKTQEQQKQNLVYQENQKRSILAQTHLSITEVKGKINNLNRKLNAFLDEDFNLDDLIDVIEEAEDETGVRKEFIFAMLDKESDLGRFTGGCTYKNTRVKDADKKVFKEICEELGYDYKKQKISCASSQGGYGGAMGLAQFMPTTWIGYKNEVAEKTGHDPANPWRLEDGVMGMALKLQRAGAYKKKNEYSAAMIYYCGSDNPRETYSGRIASCNNYADTVTSWAEGYDDYFD